jgi:hypothetical protein
MCMINIILAFFNMLHIKVLAPILPASFAKLLRTVLGALPFSWFES